MIITNNYIRKLVWGIGFAIFCLILYIIYSYLLKKPHKVYTHIAGKKYILFSIADVFLSIVMITFAGIRLNVGSDYYNYYITFNSISPNTSLDSDYIGFQGGFYILSYIIKQFTYYEYAIFIAVALILYGYLFYLINKECTDKATAIACFFFWGFFANSLNIIKQCLAMIFVMSFYLGMKDHKIIRSVLSAILAVLFHYSALFAIVMIFILRIIKFRPSYKLLIISVVGGIILFAFLPQVIDQIMSAIPSSGGYANYMDWRRNNQFRLIIAVAGMSLMYFILLIYLIRYKEQIKAINNDRYLEITFLIVGLCINIASIRIWVVQRVALYFYQFIILICPTLFESVRTKTIKRALLISMFVFLIFHGIFMGENEYYSYNTIFSSDKPIYDADYNRIINR